MTKELKTKEEADFDELKDFISAIRWYVHYWKNLKDKSEEDKLDGLAFSILNCIDGTSCQFQGFDLKSVKTGKVLNENVMLHEMYYGEKR